MRLPPRLAAYIFTARTPSFVGMYGVNGYAILDVLLSPFRRVGRDNRGALLSTQRVPSHFTVPARTPGTTLLDGQDATAYILTANINRRHMTKGQPAMVVAMVIPLQQGKKKTSSETEEVSSALISNARTVLRHTPDAAPLVLSGALSLDMAYKNARDCQARTAASAFSNASRSLWIWCGFSVIPRFVGCFSSFPSNCEYVRISR
jgi:hypothetical protein